MFMFLNPKLPDKSTLKIIIPAFSSFRLIKYLLGLSLIHLYFHGIQKPAAVYRPT
jgi:hypothetical protein